MKKQDIMGKILAYLEDEIHTLDQYVLDAECESLQEQNVPASQIDHRSLEAGLLAKAQTVRVNIARNQLSALKTLNIKNFKKDEDIGISALVELEHDGETHYYFLSPQGGGLSIFYEGHKIEVITPNSPLGEELLEKRINDEVVIESPRGLLEYRIKDVS